MKKILTLILVLALSLTVMVGCDKIPGLDKLQLPDFGIDLGNLGLGNNDQNNDETPDETPAPEVDADLKSASDFIHMSAKEVLNETGANFELPSAATVGGKTYQAVWEVIGTDLITITEHETKENVVVLEGDFPAGTVISVKGVIDSFRGNYQIKVFSYEDITFEN